MKRILTLAALPLAIGACTNSSTNNMAANDEAARNAMPAAADAEGGVATVSLAAADGSPRGSATFTDGAQGVAVQVTAAGLPAGEHGIHVHTVGRCDPPKFETAGAHWNPTNKQHGRDNPQGAHAGDMPNLTIGADGSGTASFTLAGESLAQLLDADGAALVIHAKPDDYKTDPSGDSGDRIACGVVTKS